MSELPKIPNVVGTGEYNGKWVLVYYDGGWFFRKMAEEGKSLAAMIKGFLALRHALARRAGAPEGAAAVIEWDRFVWAAIEAGWDFTRTKLAVEEAWSQLGFKYEDSIVSVLLPRLWNTRAPLTQVVAEEDEDYALAIY